MGFCCCLVLAAGVVAVILNLVLPVDDLTVDDDEGKIEQVSSERDVEGEIDAPSGEAVAYDGKK